MRSYIHVCVLQPRLSCNIPPLHFPNLFSLSYLYLCIFGETVVERCAKKKIYIKWWYRCVLYLSTRAYARSHAKVMATVLYLGNRISLCSMILSRNIHSESVYFSIALSIAASLVLFSHNKLALSRHESLLRLPFRSWYYPHILLHARNIFTKSIQCIQQILFHARQKPRRLFMCMLQSRERKKNSRKLKEKKTEKCIYGKLLGRCLDERVENTWYYTFVCLLQLMIMIIIIKLHAEHIHKHIRSSPEWIKQNKPTKCWNSILIYGREFA